MFSTCHLRPLSMMLQLLMLRQWLHQLTMQQTAGLIMTVGVVIMRRMTPPLIMVMDTLVQQQVLHSARLMKMGGR